MIGDGYFQLRAQIGTSLFSLAKLARELESPESALAALQDLQGTLREPFTFLTLGPGGSGKSALLNALFGREFAGEPALAGRSALFRHGAEPSDQAVGDELVEAARPHIFLRDFTLVDTPALEAGAPMAAVVRRFLGTADLVLVVFSVQGEGPAAWDFLARIEGEVLRRFIFVLQQADTVSPDELPLQLKRLRHTMLTRLSSPCPVFAVSAQTRAGMEKLERHIDDEIIGAPLRAQRLSAICISARVMLEEISAGSRQELEQVEQTAQTCAEQRLVLQDRRDESLRQIAAELWSLAQAFDAAERRGAHILQRKLSWRALLKENRGWEEAFEREVDVRLRDAVARQLETTFEHTHADLQDALETHREELRKLGADPALELPQDRTPLLGIFTAALGARDQSGPIAPSISARYAQARTFFRVPAAAVAGLGLLALGALALPRFFPPMLGIWLLTLAGAALASYLLRRGLDAELKLLIARQRETVITGIEQGVRAEIDRFYQELTDSLLPFEEAGQQRRTILDPFIQRVRELGAFFDRAIANFESSAGTSTGPTSPPPEIRVRKG